MIAIKKMAWILMSKDRKRLVVGGTGYGRSSVPTADLGGKHKINIYSSKGSAKSAIAHPFSGYSLEDYEPVKVQVIIEEVTGDD